MMNEQINRLTRHLVDQWRRKRVSQKSKKNKDIAYMWGWREPSVTIIVRQLPPII
jgi:hypothetical protein